MKHTKNLLLILSLLALSLSLGSCRSETQNQIRRQIQDFTGAKMYIYLYALDGSVVYEGTVDGKVTRSDNQDQGAYIYWYDDKGVYFQSSLEYMLTSKRPEVIETP